MCNGRGLYLLDRKNTSYLNLNSPYLNSPYLSPRDRGKLHVPLIAM